MRRLPTILIALALLVFASAANALTARDVIELSKAGVSDQVLLALIQVDRRVYTIDAEAVKSMKAGGVSDTVMLAMINAGREDTPPPTAASSEAPAVPVDGAAQAGMAPQPQVVVIDHTSSQPAVREVPVAVPVAVSVAIPVGGPPYGAPPRPRPCRRSGSSSPARPR